MDNSAIDAGKDDGSRHPCVVMREERNRLTTCDPVYMRMQGVEVELEKPRHGLEVPSGDLHR